MRQQWSISPLEGGLEGPPGPALKSVRAQSWFLLRKQAEELGESQADAWTQGAP